MKISKKLFAFLFLVTSFISLSAETLGTKLELKDLIDIALKNNTQIQVSKEQLNIKKLEIKKAKAVYLPILSVNANIGQYDIKSAASKDDGTAKSLELNANQLIYDFGKTNKTVDIRKGNFEASKKDVVLARNSIVLSVKQAYYDILNNYEKIKVYKEAIKLDELQLIQANEYFNAGIRTQIDITNAELKLSSSKLSLIQEEYALKIAKTKLISLLGKDFSNLDMKASQKDIISLSKSVKYNEKSLEELIQIALINRKEIEKQKSLIKVNKDNIELIDTQYYPKIDMNGVVSRKDSDDIASLDIDQNALILNVKWNFYTGKTTQYDKLISKSQLKTNYEQLKEQKLKIKEEVTSSYFNLQQSFKSIEIGLLNLNLATKNLSLADQRYKAGLNDLIELNDGKFEYTKAKNSLVDSYYGYLKSLANLEYSLGLY